MKRSENDQNYILPKEILEISNILKRSKFKAYLIGGCVRDILLNRKPKDWDFTTDAIPEEIVKLFPKTFYENEYGTVGVLNETDDESLKVVEITPFRCESGYTDYRRPTSVIWSKNLDDDLKRRDFTINAIALEIISRTGDRSFSKGHIIDPYKGQDDLKLKVIRAVGNPSDRFKEDALRMFRAIRIASEISFDIDSETKLAIEQNSYLIMEISSERIRDEFSRIIMSENPMNGLITSQKLGILKHIIPELEKTVNVEQNKAHSYDVWEHSLRSLQHAASKKWPIEIRLSALFHDISKPETRRFSHETGQWTFYSHETVGSRVTERILTRLKFSPKIIEKVAKLVRWHMFFSDTEQITLSAVRRLVSNVGKEYIWDLMNLRACDRIGTGRPKENPYRLRKYKSMIEEVMRDPLTVGMLKIDGHQIMHVTHETAGPRIGYILHTLLDEILENPKLNEKKYLTNKAIALSKLNNVELKKIADAAKKIKESIEEMDLKAIRKRYHVE